MKLGTQFKKRCVFSHVNCDCKIIFEIHFTHFQKATDRAERPERSVHNVTDIIDTAHEQTCPLSTKTTGRMQ